MSAAMVLDTESVTVYVRLLDEGVDVVRPTAAVRVGNADFRILATANYDPDDEIWEFIPGTVVSCETEMRGGEEILVARTSVVRHNNR